ncbi:MAG: hypothetical protein AMS15_03805 [Planctomycetes bacterium DG_23]|nr:MAG: hypothetical protein AMS15_03805 [Planctomycetes bacterium DG_23]
MQDKKNKEIRALGELIKGYENRVKLVTEYMTQAADLLAGLRKEQDVMLRQLRNTLAQRRSLRHKDFDLLVGHIISERRERLEALPLLVQDFRRAELVVVSKLRQLLKGNAADFAQAWPELKKQMLSLQRMRERNVARALKRVHIEQEELCRGLKGLLAKGERVRIADLKAVVREINAVSPQEMVDLAGVFRDCESACIEVSEVWQKVV